MKSVDAWEVRGLKVFCILSAIVAGQAFVLRLLEINSLTAINVTQLGASVVWLLTALYAYANANAARYLTLLTVAMTATFIGVYVVTAADIMGFLERSGGESLIAGRAAEHTFSTFYALILLGVFLVRLRAVLVWFALCLVFPAQAVFAIAINPQVYFTNDHLILAADGNAINSGMFQQNLVIAILLAACLYSLTLFYRWALKSSVELEKSKENYRRYSPQRLEMKTRMAISLSDKMAFA